MGDKIGVFGGTDKVNRRAFIGSAGGGAATLMTACQPVRQAGSRGPSAAETKLAGMTLPELRKKYHDELFQVYLPFWEKHGIDHELGGFICSLDYDGTQAGELRLQRCDACANVYFPPRPFCPACASRKVSVFRASGKATLYSYVIHHRPAPGFTPPYAIAVVELAEGPRMMTNIIDCPQTPEALALDMKLEVAFEKPQPMEL